MKTDIELSEAMQLKNALFIDLRSESEYNEATIPGAINLPLFNNQEKARLGEVYRIEGLANARDLGLELSSPKLPGLINRIKELTRQQPVILFCWRGGMRSVSISSVCQVMGIPAFRLIGGFKAYRQKVYRYLWNTPMLREAVVLHGLTGVGKTEVIEQLRQQGFAAIDLEGLAVNRGSVFGGINLPAGPGQKMFESLLAEELWSTEDYPYFVVECESRKLGRVILPNPLVEAMKKGKKLLLYDNLENRVKRLVKIYANRPEKNLNEVMRALDFLKERLGKERVEDLRAKFLREEYEQFTRDLLLNYYDPLYKYPSEPDSRYELSIDTGDISSAVERIKVFLACVYNPA